MIFFEHSSTAQGSTYVCVRCEQCAHNYAYLMKRKIQINSYGPIGLGMNPSAAEELNHALSKSCDPAPCPECGWYQAEMVERWKRLRYRWMGKTAQALIPLSILSVVVVMNCFNLKEDNDIALKCAGIVAGSMLLLSPTLLILRRILKKNANPNYEPASRRIALGRQLALSQKKYDKLIARMNEERQEQQ
jgi:hypothetical protein